MFLTLVSYGLCATGATSPIDSTVWEVETSLVNELNAAPANFPIQSTPPRESVFSYSFVEIGGMQQDPDQLAEDIDAVFGRLSIELFEVFHVFAGYGVRDTDFHDSESNVAEAGAGVHLQLSQRVDLIAEGSWLFSDVDSDLGSLDEKDTGFGLFGGLRAMVLPWEGGGLELNGGARYIELDNDIASGGEGTTGWEAGARLHFARIFSLGATYQQFEDYDALAGTVRVTF